MKSSKRRIKYPDVPLPDGKLYTDYEGWRVYAAAINTAADDVLAGYGVACRVCYLPMTVRFNETVVVCRAGHDKVTVREIRAALGILESNPDRPIYPMRPTVG